ncbi:hypothetical protein [Nocardia salmonicida]|uniref:hypothetical protein n=1 Tax=Nocardia salmonicida TaxID=53431 RepID=UPI0033C336E1
MTRRSCLSVQRDDTGRIYRYKVVGLVFKAKEITAGFGQHGSAARLPRGPSAFSNSSNQLESNIFSPQQNSPADTGLPP